MLSAITAAPAAVLSATAITVADIITLAVPVEQSLLASSFIEATQRPI